MKISKSVNIVTLSIVLIMASFTSHAMNSSENEELCRQYAVEDQIPQDELTEYLATCIQNSTETEVESTSSDSQGNSD